MSLGVWLGWLLALRFASAAALENSTEYPSGWLTAVVNIRRIGLDERLPLVQVSLRTSACQHAGTTSPLILHLGTLHNRSRQLLHVAESLELHAEGNNLKRNTQVEQIFKLGKQDVYYGRKCAKNRPKNDVGRCWPKGNILFIEREKNIANIIPDAWKPDEIEVMVKFFNPKTGDVDVNRYIHKFAKSCGEQWIDKDGVYRIGPDGIFVYMGNKMDLINVGEAYY